MYEQRSRRFGGGPQTRQRASEPESGRTTEMIEAGRESVENVIVEYPYSTIASCFALGAVVGVVVGIVLTPREPRWYERIPESFGRQWVESFLHALPESVRSRVT